MTDQGNVSVERVGSRLTITIPAHQGSEGFMTLIGGLAVCALALVATIRYAMMPGWQPLHALLLITLWFMGFCCIIFVVDEWSSHWQIELTDRSLSVRRSGLLGERSQCWNRQRLASVHVHHPALSWLWAVPELNVRMHDGRVSTMLRAQDHVDLQWIAAQLEHELSHRPVET